MFFAALLATMGTMAQTYTYRLTETKMTSAELNAKTEATYIAIKNLSKTNSYYFVGNTGAAPYSKAAFSQDAVFVWEPVAGETGKFYLKKLDGTYMQTSSPKDFGTAANAVKFTTTNPTSKGSGSTKFNGDGDSQSYINGSDDANLVRFVKGSNWINVQNGDNGTPTYNTGEGGWTIHYVYAVTREDESVDLEPEPDPTVEHTFSADKVYYIQWKNTGANYITENRDKSLTVADKKNSKFQFWRLIPVESKSHCYKVQNVVTGNYLGSCNLTPASSSRVNTSADAVEYYIGATAGSGDIAGCHYFSSTDCADYSNESAGPRALNKDGASSYIITWQAGTSRPGSYWKIVETNEEYKAPEPPVHGSSAKNLTVYFRPCGVVSNTYLTAATIGGVDPIAYTAAAKPGSFHVPFSKDRGAVRRGSDFEVSITLNSTDDADLKANAYFDWNADGEFEITVPIPLQARAATATATVTVPDDAVSGDTRMRIRLNSNGLDRADDDVEGFVYDFPLTVVDATTERKVLVDVNGANNGTVALSAAGDSHVVGAQLTVVATPKGNATFDSWREGGVVVSRDVEYTFTVEDRNMTLKAYFTPNTESEAIPAQWDFTFNRTSATAATVAVTRGGKAVEGVTATIAMSTNYKTDGKLASERTELLCSTTNSSAATETQPIKYTLTITNTTEETFAFDYIEVSNVALNSSGEYQGADVKRVRNFKVTYGSTTIGPEERYICDNSHCNGKEYPQGFGAKVIVPAGESYTIVLDIYNINHDTGNNLIGSGCFYGLSKIALGNTAVSFGTTGYTTLYAPIALTIPDGVTAYTGALDEDNTWLTLKSIEGGVIPKEHAVILESEAGNKFTLEAAKGDVDAIANNALKGQTSTVVTSTVNAGDNEAYTLQRDAEDGVAFKRYTGASLAGGKAYLMLPKSLATQQKTVRIRFADGSTGIEHSEFRIQNSEFIYDLQGRRVLNPTKGIYIVGGKKIVIND